MANKQKKLIHRGRIGTAKFPDAEQFARFAYLVESGEAANIPAKEIELHTHIGTTRLDTDDYARLYLMRPPPGESVIRLVLDPNNSQLRAYSPDSKHYWTVDSRKVLDPALQTLLGVHMKFLNASEKNVLDLFEENAYKTGVITRKQQEAVMRKAQAVKEAEKASKIQLKELGLETKTLNLLQPVGLRSVADVLKYIEKDGVAALLAIENFGEKSLIDLRQKMEAVGFPLPE